ncbi:MAG: SMC-Scp complex subunit ScpB [Acidimicrobiia bacterium]
MDNASILEAILFVAESPVPIEELAEVLEVAVTDVQKELDVLADRLVDHGLELRNVGGGWRLYSHPDTYPYLDRFAATATAGRLSQAALETLAIVAYRQPVSRSQVSEVRGVDADSALRTLERRGLVAETGRLALPGNPAVYGTTDLFLEKMGLQSLADLPPLADHVPAATVVESLEETFKP